MKHFCTPRKYYTNAEYHVSQKETIGRGRDRGKTCFNLLYFDINATNFYGISLMYILREQSSGTVFPWTL